ncbi:MAG TPA: type VI secretion system accessory protein TagJ [Acidobacteriaceae bacterium]
MDAVALYKAGQLGPAIEALGAELRMQPADTKRRTFLFELLCFAGAYDRAEKQLDVLATSNKDAGAGALLYRAALHAQRIREELFTTGKLPMGDASTQPLQGTINGEPFTDLADEDDRIGAHLEVFIAGSYTWVPFRYIERVELAPPKRLRDLLWATAVLTTTPDFRLQDLGEVLIPVLAPGSAASTDDLVRLGRTTIAAENGTGPLGQKMFLAEADADSAVQEHPLLDIREIVFTHPAPAAENA